MYAYACAYTYTRAIICEVEKSQMDRHVIPNEYEINFKDLNLAQAGALNRKRAGICNEKDVCLDFFLFSLSEGNASTLQNTDLILRNS